ncbi:MAG: YeeE/YedE family protein [Candidatus Hodarchaeales archaeon]|jgi:uncharacterized membrane protein YedE/YeeE
MEILWLLSALITGSFAGIVFQRGRACSNTAFRNLLFIKNADISIIFITAILISLIGYLFLSTNLFGFTFSSSPISFSLLLVPIGGFIFGIGMVFAGGCAGGTCYRIGEGNGKSLLAFLGYVVGILLIFILNNYFSFSSNYNFTINGKIPSFENFLPRWFWTIVIGGILLIAIIVYLRKKGAYLPHLLNNWTPIKTGIFLGVIAVFARLFSSYSGRQFGLSTVDGIIEIFSPLTNLLGLSSGIVLGWAGIFIIGLILGSFISSINLKEFNYKSAKPLEGLRFFSGGLLLGFGAMLAGGCNIGHILGGIPELGISSFVAVIFMIFGNQITSHIYYNKLRNPLPISTPLK